MTTRVEYNADGLKAKSIDGRGDTITYEYDALQRLIATTDALSHVSRINYDKAGNVVLERFFERHDDRSFSLLSRSEYEYDELDRRKVERHNLLKSPRRATDLRVDYLDSPGPGELVESKTLYDKKGRVLEVINPKNQATTFGYDAADRKVNEIDALGNRVRLFYDANGNVTRRDSHEQVFDSATGQILREDVFSTLYGYDELG